MSLSYTLERLIESIRDGHKLIEVKPTNYTNDLKHGFTIGVVDKSR